MILANNPYIVHFVSPAKPWNSFEPHPFRHKFFEYLDLTDWSGWRLTFWRRALRRLEREMKSLRKKLFFSLIETL
jgi:lipopolysaccharide biosynthesis glycosyltransferase